MLYFFCYTFFIVHAAALKHFINQLMVDRSTDTGAQFCSILSGYRSQNNMQLDRRCSKSSLSKYNGDNAEILSPKIMFPSMHFVSISIFDTVLSPSLFYFEKYTCEKLLLFCFQIYKFCVTSIILTVKRLYVATCFTFVFQSIKQHYGALLQQLTVQ